MQERRTVVVELGRITVVAPDLYTEFEVWGNCPVQGFGTVRGRELYFRARHDKWSFDVADHRGNYPSDGFHDEDGLYREGNFPDAGWMPFEEAVRIIEQCLRDYLGTAV
jgi:hypothetical protein